MTVLVIPSLQMVSLGSYLRYHLYLFPSSCVQKNVSFRHTCKCLREADFARSLGIEAFVVGHVHEPRDVAHELPLGLYEVSVGL